MVQDVLLLTMVGAKPTALVSKILLRQNFEIVCTISFDNSNTYESLFISTPNEIAYQKITKK